MARVSVVGGGPAGLAAADHAAATGHEVDLYDAGSYDADRRGAWGELVADVSRLPAGEQTAGVVRGVESIGVRVPDGDGLRQVATLSTPGGAVVDRGRVECAWRQRLPDRVSVHEDCRVSPEAFDTLCADSALVVDASGPAPVGWSVAGIDPRPSPAVTTLSTQTTGAFDEYVPEPTAVVGPNYRVFVTTKSATRATCGVGVDHGRTGEAYAAFVEVCERAGLPVPDRSDLRPGVEPVIGSRSPRRCAFEHNGAAVRLVGDAAGLVSPLSQFGLCRAIDSGVAAVDRWTGDGSYAWWLRSRALRRRLQARLMKPLERHFGGDRVLAALGRLPGQLPLGWF